MNFLHRGALTFDTLVYDTNVGDIRFHKNFMRRFVKTIYRFIAFAKLVFGNKLNYFHTSFGFNRHLFKTFHNYGQFVSPLDSYFNRERVSLGEIHEKYGHNGQVSFLDSFHISMRPRIRQVSFPQMCRFDMLQVCGDECYLHGTGSRGGQRNKNQVSENCFSHRILISFFSKVKQQTNRRNGNLACEEIFRVSDISNLKTKKEN